MHLYIFFRVSFFQCILEMLGFRKLSGEHAEWSKTAILSHLFAFIIKKVTLS